MKTITLVCYCSEETDYYGSLKSSSDFECHSYDVQEFGIDSIAESTARTRLNGNWDEVMVLFDGIESEYYDLESLTDSNEVAAFNDKVSTHENAIFKKRQEAEAKEKRKKAAQKKRQKTLAEKRKVEKEKAELARLQEKYGVAS